MTSFSEGNVVYFLHYSKSDKEAQVLHGTVWFLHHGEVAVVDSKGVIYKVKQTLLYS